MRNFYTHRLGRSWVFREEGAQGDILEAYIVDITNIRLRSSLNSLSNNIWKEKNVVTGEQKFTWPRMQELGCCTVAHCGSWPVTSGWNDFKTYLSGHFGSHERPERAMAYGEAEPGPGHAATGTWWKEHSAFPTQPFWFRYKFKLA